MVRKHYGLKKYYVGRENTRIKVRIRDDFTCKDCGKRRTPLFVKKHNEKCDGLKGMIKLFDVHHINGLCGKLSQTYENKKGMKNMITLCHKCHYNRPEHAMSKSSKHLGKVGEGKVHVVVVSEQVHNKLKVLSRKRNRSMKVLLDDIIESYGK